MHADRIISEKYSSQNVPQTNVLFFVFFSSFEKECDGTHSFPFHRAPNKKGVEMEIGLSRSTLSGPASI